MGKQLVILFIILTIFYGGYLLIEKYHLAMEMEAALTPVTVCAKCEKIECESFEECEDCSGYEDLMGVLDILQTELNQYK